MKLLHVIASLDPATGGTAAALAALTPELAELGHATETVCLDAPGLPHLAGFPGPVHALGPARLGYRFASALDPWLRSELPRFDAAIVHGLWQYHGLAVRRAAGRTPARPYFVIPHGMLDPWFQQAYPLKHLKKRLYWRLAERRILRDAAAVLFTSAAEQSAATRSFGSFGRRSRVIAFGTTGVVGDPAGHAAAWRQHSPAAAAVPFWLFLGRIHAKKGVDLLLAAYAAFAARHNRPPPDLVIAGPCADPAYLAALQAQAAATCAAGRVHWTGPLAGAAKWGALRAAEVFVLPSHQENFGVAVAEALSCGTPVLISDKVNIWREIRADAAGLVAADDVAGTGQLLAHWSMLSANARAAMRVAAAGCFARRYTAAAAARDLAGVLAAPVAGGAA